MLQVFCPGAASHLDLWDHKPELEKRHGQKFDPGLVEIPLGVDSANGSDEE